MTAILDAATGIGSRIGRHFSVSAVLPALFLTLWVYLLVESGAPQHHPDLARLGHAFSSVTHFAWLAVIAVAVGLLLHPLQFPATQLLEGYWGSSDVAVAGAAARARHYRRRQRILNSQALDAVEAMERGLPKGASDIEDVLDREAGDGLLAHSFRWQEVSRDSLNYPDDAHDIMPTLLGNVLRRHEANAGRVFGLDILEVAPYLSMVAPQEQTSYVDDAREEMDTAISLVVAGTLATIVTAAILMLDRTWLLVALVPYGLAYVAYRGAVAAAQEYGTALSVMVTLSRFELYQRLHLELPDDLADEVKKNKRLSYLFGDDGAVKSRAKVRYKHQSR
jgi:hypothetical protein